MTREERLDNSGERIMLTCALWLMAALLAGQQAEVPAEVLIENVRIYDGTGQEAQLGDVAVHEGRISAVGHFKVVGEPRRIDGTGLIAAPGFIDLHTHCDRGITEEATRINKNYLTQGVTTVVTGNCGAGPWDVGQFYDDVDAGGAGTNVAHLIPHGAVRTRVMGSAKRPPTPEELQRMKELIAQGMRSGAWGISTGLIYTPGSYADIQELIALSRVVGRYGGVYASHVRGEGVTLLDSVSEAIEIGRRAELPVHISHFKASGEPAWGLATAAIRMIEQARAEDLAVTADQYPYVASSTSLAAMVVPEAYRNKDRLNEALADPSQAAALRKTLTENLRQRSDGAALVIASYSPNRTWHGRNLAELAKQQGCTVEDLVLEIQKNGGARMVNFGMQEEEVRQIMQQPFVATASDGGTCVPDDTVPHPRNYGCFPRKIGRYAIEWDVVSLPDAIRSATGLPADIFGMTDRGYLRAGYVADIVVFDPLTFRDQATYQQPHQYSTGVRYLLVNGRLAIDDGQVTGQLQGRALRLESNRERTGGTIGISGRKWRE
jgi:N-acyl-D-amino-acid deacylase